MNKKIGRNSPCPCGSGKKYKNCCADLAEVIEFSSDPWVKSNQLMTELKVKLEENYSPAIKKARRDAMQSFLRFTTDENNMAPDYEAIFSDWLWFDYEFKAGKTIGQDYAEQNIFLAPVLKETLHSLNKSFLSVYCVKASKDNLLQITDLFSGKDFEILLKEPWETEIIPRILLLGRVVTIMDNNIFSGMVLVLQATEDQELFLLQHVKHWQDLSKRSISEMLKTHGEIILGFFDHAYHKNLIRLQELYSIPITLTEKEALLAGLLSSDYSLAFQIEDFDWYKPNASNDHYCRIAIGEESALFSADFLKDIDDMEKIILDSIGKVEMKMIHSKLAGSISPGDLRLWFLIMKDQETERWLSTPMVDLEDQTPKQVLMESDGKERIIALLDGFIAMAATDEFDEMRDILCYIQNRIIQM
ncbi:MAG TPA: SEC-C metal-binding domain-containing protein [Syntrophomonadaceae bacterium]|nr:SEC-C metal-binding domain-containing protein [Syntrophomonadaceae bacterium]HPR92451.1 SEC-C metal-binding domain-containing protein [Syntrophomonadaceae bacterium]